MHTAWLQMHTSTCPAKTKTYANLKTECSSVQEKPDCNKAILLQPTANHSQLQSVLILLHTRLA